MIKDYFKISSKNLRHRGLRSWLTILGIFIGIAAVVALISMGAGLREAVIGQFGALSVDKLTIQNKGTGFGPPGSTVVEKLTDKDVEIIEDVSGVELVIPRLIRVVNIEYDKISSFGYAADIPESDEGRNLVYEEFDFELEEGRLIRGGERGVVLLGYDFYKTEKYEKQIRVGKSISIEGEIFDVVGILKPSGSFQLNSVALLPSEDLQKLVDADNEWDLIVAKVENQNEIEEVGEKIENELRRDRKEDLGKETFTVETPLQSLDAVNTILNIINVIVIGIAMISLIVGGVGIANTMYTSVVERRKEIGIMKAIGAQNKDILTIFLIESGLLGLVGGIVGAVIGITSAIGVSSLANSALRTNLFIISINYYLLIGAVLFSFFIGIIFGVFPAVQASKLNVIDALRK